jgi:hypothetical protein
MGGVVDDPVVTAERVLRRSPGMERRPDPACRSNRPRRAYGRNHTSDGLSQIPYLLGRGDYVIQVTVEVIIGSTEHAHVEPRK